MQHFFIIYVVSKQLSPGHKSERGTLRETFFASQLSAAHQITIPTEGDFMVDNSY